MLSTDVRQTCHPAPAIDPALARMRYERRTDAERALLSFLPRPGSTATLDDAVDALSTVHPQPYEVVASLIRKKAIVVEFEAEAKPFPHRAVVVRRI